LAEIIEWLLTTSGLKYAVQVTRDEIIRLRYAGGETLSALAREFGISPQRVHQIVNFKMK
jgi:DNA-directed RNA polymerase sigma subunit (sigma70/sigma32)